jgi:pilus assembly protein CpaE
MTSTEITVGILAPSAEDGEQLRSQVNASGLAEVGVEVAQYSAASDDRPTRRIIDTQPEIIIVDMEDPTATIKILQVLHAALPKTWLLVSSGIDDPELIIETMRAGAREYLIKPIPPRTLSQTLDRYVAEKQRYRQKKDAGKIYCVISAKGGAGTTTLTVNVASSLTAVRNSRVALIDLSPVGDAAAYLNLRPRFNMSDAFAAAPRLDAALLNGYMSHAHGFALLPGPKEFAPESVADVNALARILEVAAQTYKYLIVDLPPSMNKKSLQLVTEMAARIVVVLTPELPALWRTQALVALLSTCGGAKKLRLVLNRSGKSDEITEREIEKVLKHPLYWKLPNNYKASMQAINSGRPVVATEHSDLARGYRDLACRLAGLPLPEKRRGLLGF